MLISIVGGPSSGKTTAAAGAFFSLKKNGINAQFLTEQARIYIAAKKWELNLSSKDRFELSDEDQVKIMTLQVEHEEQCAFQVDQDIIVADSSPFNSLLYMSEETKNSEVVKSLVQRALALKPIVFYSPMLTSFASQDALRLHNENESKHLDSKVHSTLESVGTSVYCTLFGDASRRADILVAEVLHKVVAL
jgi:hypothetical protein